MFTPNIGECQPKPIQAGISFESHLRLIRAVAAYIYRHLQGFQYHEKPIPWLPEILDYLCADIDCILHEIDKCS